MPYVEPDNVVIPKEKKTLNQIAFFVWANDAKESDEQKKKKTKSLSVK